VDYGDAPGQAVFLLGLLELAPQPFALGPLVERVLPVEHEEARVPPTKRAIEPLRVHGREVTEVIVARLLEELMVAHARKEAAVLEERLLDVEDLAPLIGLPPVLDVVARVEEEIARRLPHRAHHRGVRRRIGAVVAVNEERELRVWAVFRCGRERAS